MDDIRTALVAAKKVLTPKEYADVVQHLRSKAAEQHQTNYVELQIKLAQGEKMELADFISAIDEVARKLPRGGVSY